LLRKAEGVDGDAAADLLLGYFGSMRAVMTATASEQRRAVGDPQVVAFLGLVRQSMRWVLREEMEARTLLGSSEALRKYLRLDCGSDATEQVRVLFLNGLGWLIREELLARGTPNQAIAGVSQIIVRGLELGACMIVLAHNHPSGDPQPSRADRELTQRLARAAKTVDMVLYDHLIVASGRDYSFREEGFL